MTQALLTHMPSLPVLSLSLHLQADDPGAPVPGASAWRGVLGHALRTRVCLYPQRHACQGCVLETACLYPALYQPPPASLDTTSLPFALPGEPPVPFALALEAPEAGARGQCRLRLSLIGTDAAAQADVVLDSLARGAALGMGAARRGWRLTAVTDAGGTLATGEDLAADSAMLRPVPPAPRSGAVLMHLVSPLRLVSSGRTDQPRDLTAERIVMAALRRVSLCGALYGSGPVQGSFPALREVLARDAWIEPLELTWSEQRRVSMRGGAMRLGGVTGRLVLVLGALMAPLWPVLWMAERLQLGKGTALGFGHVQLAPAMTMAMAHRAGRGRL